MVSFRLESLDVGDSIKKRPMIRRLAVLTEVFALGQNYKWRAGNCQRRTYGKDDV